MIHSRSTKAFILTLLLTAALGPFGFSAERSYRTRSVVIIIMDGVRYSESFGDPKRENIPSIANEFAPQGVLYTNFRNEGSTCTNPGHVALVTGRYEAVANNGKQFPSAPTITQLFLKHADAPSSAAAVIVSKDKLHILSNGTAPGWKGQHVATTSAGKRGFGSGYREDKDTLREALQILKRDHPRLVVINFKGPDATAHGGKWKEYLGAIRECDGHTRDLWRALQSDPFYAQKTALFVTNDHGRHDDEHGGYRNHGCKCEGCRHLTLVAVGPDFARGRIVKEPAGQVDLAPTVGKLLGFAVPGSEGRVLRELFVAEPAAAPR